MRRSGLQISVVACLLLSIYATAQTNYQLYIKAADKDSTFITSQLGLQTHFASRFVCEEYVNRLPSLLQSKGYVTASVDSVYFDSTFARVVLFIGEAYRWAKLDVQQVDPFILHAVGWREKTFTDQPMDFQQVSSWQSRILDHLENHGHPFARVYLDNLQLDGEKVSARLVVDQGPFYKIDSIRVYGNAAISNNYLQHYLDIPNGSLYNKEKLLQISKRLRDLPYLEEERSATVTRLSTGAVLNLYLKKKRSSQVNVLIGFLPNNDQLSSKKLLITGEANIYLRNELGAGETIGLNWQQVQVESPRLHLIYQHPYVFRSPIGLDLDFDFFRKDTSFVNINLQFGVQYILSAARTGKLFLQRFQTILSGVNEQTIIQDRRLPDAADVSSFNVGVDYSFNNTDYRLNPRKGNEFQVMLAVGNKKIKRNNEILSLKDPSDPSFDFARLYDTLKLKTYQLRSRLMAAKYFPLGTSRSTIKTALNAGIFQSGNIFRNELFQLGGFKLLRGFDEESQYLSRFLVATLEYHYLVGQNSFFYVLADGGWGQNNSQQNKPDYTYIGTGLGLAFETKAGIFNLAWAVGKRNDSPFNLRQSKIHLGFVNYF